MASSSQVKFFDELLTDREFPAGQDANALRGQFQNLSTKSASQWIEKALSLPKRDESGLPDTPPPF